jgi:hypothetical protein
VKGQIAFTSREANDPIHWWNSDSGAPRVRTSAHRPGRAHDLLVGVPGPDDEIGILQRGCNRQHVPTKVLRVDGDGCGQ